MATTLNENDPVTVTTFFGGTARGRCVQLTTREGKYIDGTYADILKAAKVLVNLDRREKQAAKKRANNA
jgi:hypothetical protein